MQILTGLFALIHNRRSRLTGGSDYYIAAAIGSQNLSMP